MKLSNQGETNVLLSIIIPMFNSEKTIKKALDSIFEQTFDDVEIICIDDCSSDNTLNIINENFNENENITIINNTSRLGSGLSRNKGLKIAKGKYIGFLDSDDYLPNKNSLDYMINTLENNDVDMVSSNIEFRKPSGKKVLGNKLFPVIHKKTILTSDDYGMPWYFYKNIFRKEFLDKHHIDFPDLIRGQDTVFFSKVLSKLGGYIHLPITHYSYETPSVNKYNIFENYYANFISFFDVFKILLSSNYAFCNVLNEVIKKYLEIENKKTTIKTENQLLKIIDITEKLEDYLKDKLRMKDFIKIKDMHINVIGNLKYELYKIKVSVIVPVYNVEKYLPICLDSLIHQSLQDIEIICIEDKSTDDSPAILDYYAKKDDRIEVIKNQRNMGLGASRNVGMQHVNGEYTFFIDSDDWIDIDCLKTLYEKSKELNLDMIFFKAINHDDSDSSFYKTEYYELTHLSKFEDKIFNYKDIDPKYFFKIIVTAWSKLYSTLFLKKINAQFPEKLIHEDKAFFYEVMFNAKRVSYCNRDFYNRLRRKDSITTTYDDFMLGAIEIEEISLDYFLENNLYNNYKKDLLNHITIFLKSRLDLIDAKHEPEFYSKTRKLFEKMKDKYNLSEDMNTHLEKHNMRFYNSIINSADYEDFIRMRNNKKK